MLAQNFYEFRGMNFILTHDCLAYFSLTISMDEWLSQIDIVICQNSHICIMVVALKPLDPSQKM